MVFGGGSKGTVGGTTNVTIEEGAEVIYAYGGGWYDDATVSATNLVSKGTVMSIYGGNRGTKSGDTHDTVEQNTSVIVQGGTVAQIFGGCEESSIQGNTNVQILGGTVTRRIYGGCYNEYTPDILNSGTWESTNQVTGNTNVIIGAGASVDVNSDTDHGLLAVSRYGSMFDNEWGTIVFKGGIDLTSKLGSSFFTSRQSYHYLVKATANGDVVSANGLLYVTPETGYTATVTYGSNNTEISANENGTYTLPKLADKNSKITVTVTFSE